MLENKLNITNQFELVKEEERISKIKAKALYLTGDINKIEVGTFKELADIHYYYSVRFTTFPEILER